MDKDRDPKPEPFSLEVDGRTDEERERARKDRERPKFALGSGGSDAAMVPMDSEYQPEKEDSTPRIRFNPRFAKGIQGIKEDPETDRFNMEALFKAVASGDVRQLDGLQQYLERTRIHLTDSLYKSNGKTALIKALLNLRGPERRNETVEHLLDIAEKMGDLEEFVRAAYTDSYYMGQSALHIAIEKRSLHYVQLLIQKGADIHAKACGKFFQPHNGPYFYFGELPLSLAACTNQKNIVDFLMTKGPNRPSVDVSVKDSQGNTVLHALVMVADNSPENTEFVIQIYDHILALAAKLNPKTRLEDMTNKKGLTSVKLAAKTGKIGLFTHMMRREFHDPETRHLSRKFTEWVYGPVHSSLYDLASLDTYERNSVLEILVYGSDIPNRLAMLQLEPLSQLLEEKWSRFARWIFFIRFLFYFLYLCIFTATSYYRREGKGEFDVFPEKRTIKDYLLFSGQAISVLGAVYFFIKGLLEMRKNPPNLQTLMVDGYSELLFLLQGLLLLICTALYFCGRQEYLAALVLCLALAWINLLYFSRGLRHMGIYSVMMQKMILGDIIRFLFVYIVFLFGFSAAVVTLLHDKEDTDPSSPSSSSGTNSTKGRTFFAPVLESKQAECTTPTFKSISFTTLELFKFTIGMGNLEFSDQSDNIQVFYILLISYIVLTYILLLNMLIALMNKRVEKLSSESENIWRLQRAITILDMERTLPHCLRMRCGTRMMLPGPEGEEYHWCFRVEEVNWKEWNTTLGINEDPGNSSTPPAPGKGKRSGFLHDVRWQKQRTYQQDVHEMSPLSPSDV